MDRHRDDRAGDAQALGDVALHLRPEHQLGRALCDGLLDFQVVVGDQRLDAVELRSLAYLARELAAEGAEADHGEAHLFGGDSRCGDDMGRIAEHEHALAGQVGRIDRARVPGQARLRAGQRSHPGMFARQHRIGADPGERSHLGDEGAGAVDAHRRGLRIRHAERALQPRRQRARHFRVQADVEVGLGQALQVVRRRAQRCDHVDVDAEFAEQPGDLDHVVAAAEAEDRRPEQVRLRARAVGARRAHGAGRGDAVGEQRAGKLVEGFGGAPVLLLRVRGQFQRHHRHRQAEGLAEVAGLVLQQFGRARFADQHGLGLVALVGFGHRGLHHVGSAAAEVACLERGVADRRTLVLALDHREQQVGVGVALRRMQHVVHVAHRGRDAHRADMRGAFIGPEGQLHRRLRQTVGCAARAGARTLRQGPRPGRSRGSG